MDRIWQDKSYTKIIGRTIRVHYDWVLEKKAI